MSSLCFIFNTQRFLDEQVLLLQSFHPSCLGREGAAHAQGSTASASGAGSGPAVAEHELWDTAAFVTRTMTANSGMSHRAIILIIHLKVLI